jgi:FixJ family two-component response regulator
MMTASDAPTFECVVLDRVMPDLDGLGVLGKMREAGLSLPVIVQTAHGGIDTVVSAMRAGAVDFVVKAGGRRAHAGVVAQRHRHAGAGGRVRPAQA